MAASVSRDYEMGWRWFARIKLKSHWTSNYIYSLKNQTAKPKQNFLLKHNRMLAQCFHTHQNKKPNHYVIIWQFLYIYKCYYLTCCCFILLSLVLPLVWLWLCLTFVSLPFEYARRGKLKITSQQPSKRANRTHYINIHINNLQRCGYTLPISNWICLVKMGQL